MPRNPTMTCAACDRPIWAGTTSLPQGKATCRPCRAIAAQAKRKPVFVPELRQCKRCGEMFEAHRFNMVYCNPECRDAGRGWGARPPRVASSAERGYGKEHQAARARWKKRVDAQGGIDCCLCGEWVEATEQWHLDHTPDRDGYRGVAHARCNVKDGAIRGNQGRDRPTLIKACTTCGAQFPTIYPRQSYCSVQCRPPRESTKRRAA